MMDDRIKLTFRDAKGNDIKTIEGNEGDDLLSLAHDYDVDLEGESASWLSLDWNEVWKRELQDSEAE